MRFLNSLFTIFILCLVIGCSKQESTLPEELFLSNPTYDVSVSHMFGPSGINHSFKIYDIAPEVTENIKTQGLGFLNSLPSTQNFVMPRKDPAKPNKFISFWSPYQIWKRLPIQNDGKWSSGPKNHNLPTNLDINEFWGQYYFKSNRFSNRINPEYIQLFNEAFETSNGYYAYGGYLGRSLLVIFTDTNQAIFLFRG